ncbi:MAG: transglutaminase domain-containing protein [Planctomycetales bacterium]
MTAMLRSPLLRRGTIRLAVLSLVAAAAAATLRAEDQDAAVKSTRESWQVIYLGDDRIGYAHSTTAPAERDGRKVIRSVSETSLTLKRFGQTLQMTIRSEFEETAGGDLLSFTHVTENPPASSTRMKGRVEGKELHLETKTAGVSRQQTLPWTGDVKAPDYQERTLRDPPLKPGDVRRFKLFVPDLKQATDVRVAADDYQTVKLHDGKSQRLLKVRITQSVLPTLTTRAWLDEQGRTLRSESDLFGLSMITYEVPETVALEEIAGGELDLAINTLVRVRPIRTGHDSRRVVYRLTTPDADPAEFLLSGDTQQMKKLGEHQAELTVTALPIPEKARLRPTAAEYLASSEFLQSQDRRVVDHARRAAAGERDPGAVARRMERYVHEKVDKKNFSTAMATAAEVAERLEGDCTEHAVLLAAMLRAEKIPSRVAVGLVYLPRRNAFAGHMWTEVRLDERWVPLDAMLGKGGIGAAHIKLAESGLSDDGPSPLGTFLPLLKVLGNIQIEIIEAE